MQSHNLRGRLLGSTGTFYELGNPRPYGECERELGLSSPSVAAYHLEKLMNLEVVKKNTFGDYELGKTVSLEVMNSSVKISQLMIPRYMFYSIFFFTLLIVFVVGYAHTLSIQGVFALIFGGSGVIIMAYETWRHWRLRPI